MMIDRYDLDVFTPPCSPESTGTIFQHLNAAGSLSAGVEATQRFAASIVRPLRRT